jgi:hypothetical protein
LKHVKDNLTEIDYKEKCAYCWSFSHMCIMMHGSENGFKEYEVHLQHIGVGGKVTLKWFFKKSDGEA